MLDPDELADVAAEFGVDDDQVFLPRSAGPTRARSSRSHPSRNGCARTGKSNPLVVLQNSSQSADLAVRKFVYATL